MSRSNQWFVPGEGIAREVITADIQRYLGPDALVRPGGGTGDHEGRQGYWITAYRTLTSQMIQDLRLDSQRWTAEKNGSQRGHGSGVNYQDSQTHASRQHYGPSEGYAQPSYSNHPSSAYGTVSDSPHYTTAPTPSYSHQPYGQPAPSHPAHNQPRTDPYAYGQAPPGRADYGYTAANPSYPYSSSQIQDPYGRSTTQPPQYTTQPPSVVPQAAPGYYIASDGRQYPLSQQPQQPPQANPNRRRDR